MRPLKIPINRVCLDDEITKRIARSIAPWAFDEDEKWVGTERDLKYITEMMTDDKGKA